MEGTIGRPEASRRSWTGLEAIGSIIGRQMYSIMMTALYSICDTRMCSSCRKAAVIILSSNDNPYTSVPSNPIESGHSLSFRGKKEVCTWYSTLALYPRLVHSDDLSLYLLCRVYLACADAVCRRYLDTDQRSLVTYTRRLSSAPHMLTCVHAGVNRMLKITR